MKTIFCVVIFVHALAVILLMNMVLQVPQHVPSQKLFVKTVTLASERVLPPVKNESVIAAIEEQVASEPQSQQHGRS